LQRCRPPEGIALQVKIFSVRVVVVVAVVAVVVVVVTGVHRPETKLSSDVSTT